MHVVIYSVYILCSKQNTYTTNLLGQNEVKQQCSYSENQQSEKTFVIGFKHNLTFARRTCFGCMFVDLTKELARVYFSECLLDKTSARVSKQSAITIDEKGL